MFPKWIWYLLKFSDICSFYTEISSLKSHKQSSIKILVFHILWAITLTFFVIKFSTQPIILDDVLPFSVNSILQYSSGMFTYWVMIVESYAQRKTQRKFWELYERMNPKKRKWLLRSYAIKLIELFVVLTPIQIYFMYYFMFLTVNDFFFRIALIFCVVMYQYRVFYYLLYLEFIKRELENIRNDLEMIIMKTNINSFGSQDLVTENLKNITQYYNQVYQLSNFINQMFGWSNFTTILYCFHLPLTEINWGFSMLNERTRIFGVGINFNSKQIE